MKNVILIITMLTLAYVLTAQNTDESVIGGTIVYEQTIKLDLKLEGEGSEFSSMLPKERKTKKILFFNDESSLYENVKEEKNDDMNDMASEGFMIKIEEPNNILYTDFKNKTQIEQKEFMTRLFLIESDLETKGWKLTGKQKKVLNYTCQEAIKEKDSIKIRAWFTPEIVVSAGPGHINGLPGLVLAADIDNGQRTIIASKINIQPVDKSIIVKPKKGKKVTEEEFRSIVDEKMKEMGAEGGGDGPHMIMEIKIEK